jgi:hypothetical protein
MPITENSPVGTIERLSDPTTFFPLSPDQQSNVYSMLAELHARVFELHRTVGTHGRDESDEGFRAINAACKSKFVVEAQAALHQLFGLYDGSVEQMRVATYEAERQLRSFLSMLEAGERGLEGLRFGDLYRFACLFRGFMPIDFGNMSAADKQVLHRFAVWQRVTSPTRAASWCLQKLAGAVGLRGTGR